MSRKVLITGATGFLGRNLVDKFLINGDSLILLARNECKLAALISKYSTYVDADISYVCGDIKDKETIDSIFDTYKPDSIVHTAALKRIDICQDNPIESVKTNIVGLINIIDNCKKHNTDLIFVSTDKACLPSTTYGATKYVGEQLVRKESSSSRQFKGCAIRYGNVLGSTGSVLHSWREQYEKTGNVQVRDKEMTRFFWDINMATDYILGCVESIGYGDIFVPELKALNIYEMACHIYGEENVVMTGCTHNEKIHESLTGDYHSQDNVVSSEELLGVMDVITR